MEILNITHKVKSIEEIDSENKIINVEKIITETGLTQEGQIETCFTNLIISARKQILKKNLTPKGIKKK